MNWSGKGLQVPKVNVAPARKHSQNEIHLRTNQCFKSLSGRVYYGPQNGSFPHGEDAHPLILELRTSNHPIVCCSDDDDDDDDDDDATFPTIRLWATIFKFVYIYMIICVYNCIYIWIICSFFLNAFPFELEYDARFQVF